MNVNQLRKILKAKFRPLKNRVRLNHYWELLNMKYVKHLEVRDADICYKIIQFGGEWEVVRMERNSIREKMVFDEEEKACLYFKELMERVYQDELGNP